MTGRINDPMAFCIVLYTKYIIIVWRAIRESFLQKTKKMIKLQY